MPYECHIVVDFEFNPVKKEYSDIIHEEIIEIGAIKLNPDFEEIGRFSCLVRPEFNDFIEPKITKLTGIKTNDVDNAIGFETALRMLSEWIGPVKARIYSWSDNDLRQLCNECYAKQVSFPDNMTRWMDLQRIYQRIIHYPCNLRMALSYASKSLEIAFNKENAHNALYDTEITAEILRTVKNADFITNQRKAHRVFIADDRHSTYSLGSACGDTLAALKARLAVA